MITLKTVLVATDFGAPSETAMAYGRNLARAFGARLHVLHVSEIVVRPMGVDGGFVPDLSDLQRRIDEAARQQLEAFVRDDDRSELGAELVLKSSTSPARAIVEYAKEANIDLIVMGTHGRGAVGHLLMGSVAERVVRTAPCPVLTVRSPQHEFIGPDALQVPAQA